LGQAVFKLLTPTTSCVKADRTYLREVSSLVTQVPSAPAT